MHIVYITNEFVTEKHFGGLATYLDNITNIMSEHGHRVTVITLSDRNQIVQYKKNITVMRVETKISSKALSDFGQALLQYNNSWRVYKILQELHSSEKVDIVQTANYKAVGVFRDFNIPTVVRASSDSACWRNANNVTFDISETMMEQKWVDRLELLCIKIADSAFAPSKCCANIIGKRSGKKIKVIESPYKSCLILEDDTMYKRRLLDKKYLLFNSSLSMLKGTHLGIKATDEIMKKYPELYMVYAGIDYGLAGSKKCIADILEEQNRQYGGRVIYLNKLKHEQLFPIIRHAYACLLPSRIDNLPNSCIEDMALGKIVIGTYGASFEQLIKNKKNGLLIKRDSKKALIKAVDYLMNMTEEQYIKMGEMAQETVERLSPDIVYKKMKTYYENVIEHFNLKKI